MQLLRRRLTYANVMSTIGVLLALGGATAFAASRLAKNSVGSAQLRRGSVTTIKIRKGAVNGARVKDGSLTGADIKLQTLGTVPSASKLASYARVRADGAVLPGSSLTQANVGKQGRFYCFSGLNPPPVGLVATIDYSASGKEEVIQTGIGPGPVCPAETQAFVSPRSATTGEGIEAGFFVLLY
jgi:hypothetical protein